nr:DNA-processing protein DprA [Kofleriaceae bacterium]
MTLHSTLPASRIPRLVAAGWSRDLEVRGDLAGLDTAAPSVAIVGARAATRAAMDRAHRFAAHLARRGVLVVSGGALGIDGAAHRGALAGGGHTAVVLGSGVDVPYPKRHAALFEAIVARGGALISMFPAGTQPLRHTFPRRNPLIAALADCVIVVEADVRSGSLSTARAASELARPLGACPGSPGCARLLRSGAGVIETEADVDALLAGAPRRSRQLELAELDAVGQRVAEALQRGVRGVDAVVAETGLGVRDVLRAISSIEARMS